YTSESGLFKSVIFQILEDDQQTLWMSSNRGIFSLARQAVEAFDLGRIRALPCAAYGLADGMKSTQCEGGSQTAGCRSADGRLWFPTVQGVCGDRSEVHKCKPAPAPGAHRTGFCRQPKDRSARCRQTSAGRART